MIISRTKIPNQMVDLILNSSNSVVQTAISDHKTLLGSIQTQYLESDLPIQEIRENTLEGILNPLYKNFTSDVLRLLILINLGEIRQSQQIQVYWQKVLDKQPDTDEFRFYLGLYYFLLGCLYRSTDEFEISSNYYGKADHYFDLIEFNSGNLITKQLLADNYKLLGAYDDAGYHLREIFRRDLTTDDQFRFNAYIELANLYHLTDQFQKARDYLQLADKMNVSERIKPKNFEVNLRK